MASDKSSSETEIKGNLEIHRKEGYVTVSVNPKIYPLEIVYSASYAMLDRAYIVLDGNPDEEIIVEVRGKAKEADIESLARDFNNELINYSVYKTQSENGRAVREAVLQRALATNCAEEGEEEEESYLEDPLGIAKPWEETHPKEDTDKSC